MIALMRALPRASVSARRPANRTFALRRQAADSELTVNRTVALRPVRTRRGAAVSTIAGRTARGAVQARVWATSLFAPPSNSNDAA